MPLLVFITAFAPGETGAIHAYLLDPQHAKWKPVAKTTDVEHPFFLAISPDEKHLYSIHAPGEFGGQKDEQVAAYRITSDQGELQLINRQSSRGAASCYLDVDTSGKVLFLANYLGGSVASYSLREDGSISEAISFHQHSGSSVNVDRQQGPHAHCIVVSPNNRWAYAADLGLDQILAYSFDAETSRLSPNKQPFVRTIPGAGPRHLTFHPSGQHVYVINEMANSLTVFDHNMETGFLIERQTISTLPKDFDGTSHCADVKITPDGRFIYGTNRGHDSVAAYRVESTGTLTLLDIVPSGGKGPQNLAITKDGQFLLCANMPGNKVTVFHIDAQTGNLRSIGDPLSIPSPSCIMIR